MTSPDANVGKPAEPDEHIYLSTACLHDRHDHCNAMVGYQGAKRPAQCKFCDARCVCACHVSPGPTT